MLSCAMFGEENLDLNHSFDPDDVLETLLIELLVLASHAPLSIVYPLEKLANGIAEGLDPQSVERSIEYANYRIGATAQ